MERISQALELARMQREARTAMAFRDVAEDVASDRTPADASSARAGVELGDTQMFRLPTVELSADARERERILAPGSPGAAGAPYKMLRTQVLKRLDQLGANTLAIVSANAGAGKTLTAINLAIAVAADPERTALLVDFDMCNPSIHRRFGYQPSVGVEDCLSGRALLQHAMFKLAGYDKLTVLPSRGRVERSSDLLRSQRTQEAIREMRQRYANRIVIFDLPPALRADDALAFSQYAQAGLLVVGEGSTRRDDVVRTLELLRDLPMVGTVLNGSREPLAASY